MRFSGRRAARVLYLLLNFLIICFYPKVGSGDNNGQIFISNKFGAGISILDENNFQIIKLIPPEIASAKMMASSADKIIFVEFGTITFYNNNLDKIADYDFYANPVPGLCKALVSPDGRKLYIGVIGWGKAEVSGVFIVDLKSGKTLREFKNPAMHNGRIDITREGDYLLVPEKANVINVRKASDFRSIKKINLVDGDVVVEIRNIGNNLIAAIVNPSPDIKKEEKPKHERLDIINLQTSLRQSLNLPVKSFRVIVSDPNTLFIIGDKKLSEVDIRQLRLVNTYAVNGDNIALSTDGKKLYILDSMENLLVVWDIAQRKIHQTINVGKEPYEIMVR